MTHVTCPSCQLRFTPGAAVGLRQCPFCGGSVAAVTADRSVGYQLVDPVVSVFDTPGPQLPPDGTPRNPGPPGA